MKYLCKLLAIVAVMTCSLTGQVSLTAQDVVLIDLGTLGQGYSAASALNDNGQVVGWALAPSAFGTSNHAFLWDAENGMQDLGTLNSDPAVNSSSYARDINNAGKVVGASFDGTAERAFYWDAQQGMIELTPGPLLWTAVAHSINELGVAAGFQRSWNATELTPFLWDETNGLNTIPNGNFTPYGINNLEDLAGIGPDLTAFYYDSVSGYQTLSPAGGDDAAYAWGLNDEGQAAGASGVRVYGYYGPVLTKPRAVIWSAGFPTVLPSPGFSESEALAINQNGDAAGYARSTANSTTEAVVWLDGNMIVLNDLLDPAGGWDLRQVSDINAHRQVCGFGTINGETHAFLMDLGEGVEPPNPDPPPVPELPELSIADGSVVEGRKGTTSAIFIVLLSEPTAEAVSVDYATLDGTATTANRDYAAASGTLTFAPGEQVQFIAVKVKGDRKSEPDETFFVELSSATGAVLSDATGQCTILNDD